MINTKLPYWAFTVCKILLSVLLLGSGEKTAAQGGNHWVFGAGGYGLDFSKDPPEFYKTSISPLGTTVTVSNNAGKLLFYTYNDSIWNRNHELMHGSFKSYKSSQLSYDHVISIPVPGKSDEYYVFWGNSSVAAFSHTYTNFPIEYVKLKFQGAADAGTILDSSQKTLSSTNMYNLVGIPHANKKDFWLLARGLDTLYVFSITESGINIKYKYFIEDDMKKSRTLQDKSNRLKVSNNGKHIIWIQAYLDTTFAFQNSNSYSWTRSSIKHMEFNPQNGEVQPPTVIDSIKSFRFVDTISMERFFFIDAAFSPNDSVLYALLSTRNADFPRNKLRISQYACSGINQDTFTKVFSETIEGSARNMSMRLAPNGKIIIGGRVSAKPIDKISLKSLPIIDQPDVIGKGCKIVIDGFKLPYHSYRYQNGFIDTTFTDVVDFPAYTGTRLLVKYLYRPNERCDGFTRFYNFSDSVRFENFTWYINGDSLAGYEVNYAFKQPGKYYVRLKGTTPKGLSVWFTDTVVIEGHHFKPKAGFSTQTQTGCRWVGFQFNDTSLCPYSKNGWRKWLFGDGNSYTYSDTVLFNKIEHTYTTEGNFNVKLLVNNGHCTDTFAALQQVKILDAPKPGFAISPAKGCSPLQVSLVNQSQGAVDSLWYSIDNGTTWQLTLGVFTQMITSGGAYKFMQQLKGPTGCFTYDTQAVVITQGLPVGYLPQLTSSTFTPQNQVEVNWEDNSVASLYTLEHSSNGSNFNTLVTKQSTFFLHTTPSALTENYYRLVAHDSCGNLSTPSALIKPVFLKVSAINNTQAAVTFSAYEHSNKKVWSYSIERRRDDQYKYEQVINWSPQILFADSGFFNESGYQSCYRIKVDLDSAAASYSNEVCLPYAPILWIPDAFSPNDDGLNDDFYVVHAGVKIFSIAIYNIWGGKVYESTNPSFRWLGNNMPEGIYTYVISATTLQQRVNTSGTITLLR